MIGFAMTLDMIEGPDQQSLPLKKRFKWSKSVKTDNVEQY